MEINIQPNESFIITCINGKKAERMIVTADANGMLNGNIEIKNLGGMILG